MTALMDAVHRNDANKVKQLIAQGVDVNQTDSKGDAPLIIAAYEGYAEVTRLLLEAGADVGALDPGMKATALHAAAYAGRLDTAKLLIQHGIDINKRGPYNGYTALHDAIWQNNVDVAAAIIAAGADLTVKSNDGQTPLEFARARRRTEIAALIERKLAGD